MSTMPETPLTPDPSARSGKTDPSPATYNHVHYMRIANIYACRDTGAVTPHSSDISELVIMSII